MKEIKITYCRSTGFDSFFDNVKSIMVDDKDFGGGGFGQIYMARSYDGRKNPPHQQVVKIFKPDNPATEAHSWNTINRLQAEVISKVEEFRNTNGSSDFFSEFPALQALPQLVFEGIMDGQKVRGCSTNDLNAMGLVGFDKIDKIVAIDKDEDLKYIDDYIEKDMEWRLTTAYHLVRGFNFLKSAHFIHADISPDNIFVGLNRPVAVILDYDSGAVVQTMEDNPSTYGKPQPWLAPEIAFQLKVGKSNGNCLVNLTEFTDRWSVAHAIFNLLMVMGAFCVKDMSEGTLKRYLKQYKWPQINTNDPDFIGEVENYKYYLSCYKLLPEEIRREFEFTFNNGIFDPKSRTSYYQWEQVLKNLIPAKERKNSSSTFQSRSLSNISSFVSTSSSNNRVKNNPTPDQQELIDFVNRLVVDLVAGKRRVYKTKLAAMANGVGRDGKQLVADIECFVAVFKESIKDGVITKLEKASLIGQGKCAMVTAETIEKMLAPYPRQR